MNLIISWILANLVLIATNPVSTIYVALAMVHAVAAYFYLMHGNLPHAICATLACILYLLLAHLYRPAH